MLRFMPSAVFRFNGRLLDLMHQEGSSNKQPYKRVFVNSIDDGLAFNTMARFLEVDVRLITGGLARVTYTDNHKREPAITYKDYDRKDLRLIATDIVGFLEDRLDPAKLDEAFN